MTSILLLLFILTGCVTPTHIGSNEENFQYKFDNFPKTNDPQSKILAENNDSKKQFTGLTKKIILPTEAQIGQGYSQLSGALRNFGVLRGNKYVTISHENAISYNIDYIDSYKDFVRSLHLNASASYRGFTGSVSASMSLFKSVKLTSRKAYVLVNMRIINGSISLNDYALNDIAKNILIDRQNNFLTRYGDSFISRLVKGAEMYALMEFSQDEKTSLKDLKAGIKGSYGAFSAEVNMQEKISELTKGKSVKVYYAQTGGAVGRSPFNTDQKNDYNKGGVLTLTPEELLSRIREFPEEARTDKGTNNAAVLWGEILDYTSAWNWPIDSGIPTFMEVNWSLEDLGKVTLLVNQMKYDAEEILGDPNFYYQETDQKKAKKVLVYSDYIGEQLNRIAQATISFPNLAMSLGNQLIPSFEDFHEKRDQCKKDEICSQATPTCPASQPDENAVMVCLIGTEPLYSGIYVEPEKHVIPLDGWQYSTIGQWDRRRKSREFVCNDLPIGFEIVDVTKRKSVDIYRQKGKCLEPGGKWCDSAGEGCIEVFFTDACYINTDWHNWYRDHIRRNNKPYRPSEVCK